VAEFSTVRGTHSVEFHGLPATGQQIEYQTARLFTIRDGLIVYERRLYDFRGVLDRLDKMRTDREMALASAVQHALCRTNYGGPSCTFVASSLPCRTIGGDFVEYLELPGASFGMAVGDVAGKGPAAALVAAMLQGMFSIVASTREPEPSAVLSTLNAGLHARDVHPKFATLFYGVLAPDGRFTYSNAGHQPPILVRAGETRVLAEGGPILGVFENAAFPGESVQLSPGDMVVAFSDGVTDAAAVDGADFGMERLIEVVASARARTADELLRHVLRAVETFSGPAPPTDDVTIAVVQYERPSGGG
jgi:sigma-B regulation protein RsbU (phosphoserine phosphatase)